MSSKFVNEIKKGSETYDIQDKRIVEITEADNGKIIMVEDGQITLKEPEESIFGISIQFNHENSLYYDKFIIYTNASEKKGLEAVSHFLSNLTGETVVVHNSTEFTNVLHSISIEQCLYLASFMSTIPLYNILRSYYESYLDGDAEPKTCAVFPEGYLSQGVIPTNGGNLQLSSILTSIAARTVGVEGQLTFNGNAI